MPYRWRERGAKVLESTHSAGNNTLRQGKAAAADAKGTTILFAEDDEMVRNVTLRMLEQAGYEVFVAEDGKEAVALFEQYKDVIDLAVMDVMMPGMNGHEAFRCMRRQRPQLKTLFVSGYCDSIVKRYFSLDNNTMLLQKPVLREDLLQTIQDMLDGTAQPEDAADFAPGTAP
jgi:CheY-like chemotaxis protein